MAHRSVVSPRQPGRSRGDLVYAQVLEHIVEHGLDAGDVLPTEIELCRMTGVSRSIVREALMRLHAEGVIISRRGARWHVLHRPSERQVHHLRPVRVRAWLDAFDVRIASEPAAARLAAQHRSEAGLEQVRASFSARLDCEIGDADDWRFHRAVAAASLNPLFLAILDALDAKVGALIAAAPAYPPQPPTARTALPEAEHLAILSAIESGDAEAAEVAMRFHLFAERDRVRRMHIRS